MVVQKIPNQAAFTGRLSLGFLTSGGSEMNVCDEASKPDVYEIEVVCRKNGITILREHTSFAASGRDEPIKAALKAAKVLKKLERKTAKQEWEELQKSILPQFATLQNQSI